VQYFQPLPVEHQRVQILNLHLKGTEISGNGQVGLIEENEHDVL
jgi:hypothetical protein